MKALAQKEPRQLPSNFAYVTMRRIKEEQREEERRQRQMAIITVTAVVLVGVATLLYLLGDVIWQSLVSISLKPDGFALVVPTMFCLIFFTVVNHWLSRHHTV